MSSELERQIAKIKHLSERNHADWLAASQNISAEIASDKFRGLQPWHILAKLSLDRTYRSTNQVGELVAEILKQTGGQVIPKSALEVAPKDASQATKTLSTQISTMPAVEELQKLSSMLDLLTKHEVQMDELATRIRQANRASTDKLVASYAAKSWEFRLLCYRNRIKIFKKVIIAGIALIIKLYLKFHYPSPENKVFDAISKYVKEAAQRIWDGFNKPTMMGASQVTKVQRRAADEIESVIVSALALSVKTRASFRIIDNRGIPRDKTMAAFFQEIEAEIAKELKDDRDAFYRELQRS
jgi:hypothetical protein